MQSNRNGYKDDTLIIAISNAKDKYALIFFNEMKESTYLSATRNTDKLYDNLDLFKIKLIEAARKSTIVDDFDNYLSEYNKLESDSMNRFQDQCKILSISFQRNITNSNEIDAFVNYYNVQFKSSTSHKNNRYTFSLFRNTRSGRRPYSIDDRVDFFIFEIADEKYQNNFYIIQKKILIELKYISSDDDGKYVIRIPAPNYNKYHWTLQFLNRFDQLIMDIHISLIFNNLHKMCLDKGLQCEFDKNRVISINSLKVRHITSSKHKEMNYIFNLYTQKNNQTNIIHINDGYSFIIFEFLPLIQYWIVPVYVLVNRGYISTNTNNGKFSVSIPHQEPNKNNWIEFYNNFDQLKNIPNNLLIL